MFININNDINQYQYIYKYQYQWYHTIVDNFSFSYVFSIEINGMTKS